MKRFIILFCLAVMLCGCEMAGDPTGDSSASDSIVGESVVNPMHEVTDAQLIKSYSHGLALPDGVSEASYYLYDNDLFEIRFESEGVSYCARTAPSDSYKDISGMYYDWTIEEENRLHNSDLTVQSKRYIGQEETVDVVAWYDEDSKVNYSVSAVAADLDGFDLTAIVGRMIAE